MKILYNTVTSSLQRYPRNDNEPVIGLSPELEVFDVIQEPEPIVDTGFSYRLAEPVIDTDNKTVTYGWIVEEVVEEPEANYVQFLNDVIASQVYQKAIMQAISNSVVSVGFTTTMGALILAAGGNPNPGGITSAFNLMLSAMTLGEEDFTELQSLIETNHIDRDIDLQLNTLFVVNN